jgi:hypothetical protein
MKTFTRIALSVALISIGVGIGLLIFVAAKRPSINYTPTFSSEDIVKDVRKLDISIDYGEVYITEGDEFRMEAKNLYKTDELKSDVSNGVWVINHQPGERINFLGFDFPISISIRGFKTPIIKITLPEGFIAEDIKLELCAGKLKAENLHADTAQFNVDAGLLEIDGLVIENKSSYYVGAGKIDLKHVDIRNINVECDVGTVNMKGIISGDNNIQCNVGNSIIDIDDDMDYYSFDINTDVGKVVINNKQYRNYKSIKARDDYKGSFRLNVDVGSIDMSFTED